MKMLTDKQIKRYLRYHRSNKKRLKNKAKSRLAKDYKRYNLERFEILSIRMNLFLDALIMNEISIKKED